MYVFPSRASGSVGSFKQLLDLVCRYHILHSTYLSFIIWYFSFSLWMGVTRKNLTCVKTYLIGTTIETCFGLLGAGYLLFVTFQVRARLHYMTKPCDVGHDSLITFNTDTQMGGCGQGVVV